MDKKVLKILKTIYHHENGFYNLGEDRHEQKIPETVSADDLALLAAHNFSPNNFETFEHDEAVARLLRLQAGAALDFAAAIFLKGVSGEFPRGCQPLISFTYVKHFYAHDFAGDTARCEICGIPNQKTIDKTETLRSNYLGYS